MSVRWGILCLLIAADSCRGGQETLIEFRLQTPGLGEDQQVFITGGHPRLGSWRPGRVRMARMGADRWTFQLRVPRGTKLEYKYTLGSWAREGAFENGRPLANLSVTARDDETRTDDRITHWTDRKERQPVGQLTGIVKYHRQLTAPGLRPRDVIVWLPPDYADSANRRYPVLYMHDGQNIVDPATSAFGVDWSIDETCTRLIESGRIRPLIVVGIYNTPDRSREYLPGETGTRYQDFVIEVVKPLIDHSYRTQPDRRSTFVGGSSAGGTCAFRFVWERPDVFSKAICMSPALRLTGPGGVTRIDYVTTVSESKVPQHVFFYLDNGGVGLEQRLQPGIDAMLEMLKSKGLRSGRDYVWFSHPEARHSESAWAKRFPRAIEALCGTDRVKSQKTTDSPRK